jgi:hypothetical protein
MEKMSRYYLNQSTSRGLRERLDFLLVHALIARGETTRYIQFPDLFAMEMKNEGPTLCEAAMVIMSRGEKPTRTIGLTTADACATSARFFVQSERSRCISSGDSRSWVNHFPTWVRAQHGTTSASLTARILPCKCPIQHKQRT